MLFHFPHTSPISIKILSSPTTASPARSKLFSTVTEPFRYFLPDLTKGNRSALRILAQSHFDSKALLFSYDVRAHLFPAQRSIPPESNAAMCTCRRDQHRDGRGGSINREGPPAPFGYVVFCSLKSQLSSKWPVGSTVISQAHRIGFNIS